jgi:hypothetical protein
MPVSRKLAQKIDPGLPAALPRQPGPSTVVRGRNPSGPGTLSECMTAGAEVTLGRSC